MERDINGTDARHSSDNRSHPFNIKDLGKVHVKLDKVEGASDLVKVNIVLNQATIRLQITLVKDQRKWPYQIKNLTDKTITFHQKVFLYRLTYNRTRRDGNVNHIMI